MVKLKKKRLTTMEKFPIRAQDDKEGRRGCPDNSRAECTKALVCMNDSKTIKIKENTVLLFHFVKLLFL